MENKAIMTGIKARDAQTSPKTILESKFKDLLTGQVSAQYIGYTKAPVVAGVSGLSFDSPVVSVVLQLGEINDLLTKLFEQGKSVLFTAEGGALVFAS